MASRSASRRRRGRGLKVVVAALALLGLATFVAATQTASPARSFVSAHKLTVATWNMCGVRQWGCATTGSRSEKKLQLKRLATRAGARVILLQEACAGDLESARRELGASWHSAFRAYKWRNSTGRTSIVPCSVHGQGAAGFAILSAPTLSHVTAVASRQPSVGLQRGILCAQVAAHRIEVCNAHLSPPGSDKAHPRWEYRDDQLKALVAAVPKRRTVYGGDLNVDPPGVNNPARWVWPAAPYGTHRECDQSSDSARSGRPTHLSGHKLDYLFTGLPRSGCAVRDTGASDHRALLLQVRTG
ncbi:endonuclease/exonuclease/phosphatase family protein [Streptomyces sp. NPDC056656]|uniref:endonuclease/exonuclease/phosphatase family protein n=1 Tax=Streptomyces sp. NPDC056656 TaxID=3345895 RepID=UPI0036953596